MKNFRYWYSVVLSFLINVSLYVDITELGIWNKRCEEVEVESSVNFVFKLNLKTKKQKLTTIQNLKLS